MRLLDTHVTPPQVPEDGFKTRPYAILSHTWGDDEVLLSDLREPDSATAKSGWEKIRGAQRQAEKDGLDYVWIDTCCIDKSSSAELGEAINSMFRWYSDAKVCYVYLADVEGTETWPHEHFSLGEIQNDRLPWFAELQKSKWFQRGWTLQELIAPKALQFYDKNWNLIGGLEDLAETVAMITCVHGSMLRHEQTANDFSIAQRMSWAAGRQTTRPEDRAYSLLGVLDVTMDVRYGEGSRAFIRLQEEIIERSADQSIFAWEKPIPHDEWVEGRYHSFIGDREEWHDLLAPSPDEFAGARDIIPFDGSSQPYRMTNRGLNIVCPAVQLIKPHVTRFPTKRYFIEVMLSCRYASAPTMSICLNLCITSRHRQQHIEDYHVEIRKRPLDPQVLSRLSVISGDQAARASKVQEIMIARSWTRGVDRAPQPRVWLQLEDRCGEGGFSLYHSEPTHDDGHNFTWSLEGRVANTDFVMYLRHVGGSILELHLNLLASTALNPPTSWDVPAYLALVPSGDLKSNYARRSYTPSTTSTPTKCSWKMNDTLTAVAQLRGEQINGEYMYLVDLWAEKTSQCKHDEGGRLQRATKWMSDFMRKKSGGKA